MTMRRLSSNEPHKQAEEPSSPWTSLEHHHSVQSPCLCALARNTTSTPPLASIQPFSSHPASPLLTATSSSSAYLRGRRQHTAPPSARSASIHSTRPPRSILSYTPSPHRSNWRMTSACPW